MPFVQRWDTAADVPLLNAPVLIQHGGADQLIPPANGARLADMTAGQGGDVVFVEIAGASHNNLAGQPGYAQRIGDFLSQADIPPE